MQFAAKCKAGKIFVGSGLFEGEMRNYRAIKIYDAYLASSHSCDCTCTSWGSITYAANMRESASRLAAGEKSSVPSTSLKLSHLSGKSAVRTEGCTKTKAITWQLDGSVDHVVVHLELNRLWGTGLR